jgi:hypothetical protein
VAEAFKVELLLKDSIAKFGFFISVYGKCSNYLGDLG